MYFMRTEMETKNQFEQAALEAPTVTKKPRGRPAMKLDEMKVNSFMAALRNSDQGVSSSHLVKFSGMQRAEVMRLLKSLIKQGQVVKTGAKKGSKYNVAQ